MDKTVAELIPAALAAWGVKNIYAISGDAILPLMDALGKQDLVQFYSTAGEQGAAFMACGEARVTGQPGVCLATEGPGALNLVNGVAGAFRDRIPLLVITGQVKTSRLQTPAKQYFDQQQLFQAITGFTALLTRPESVIETLKIALEKAAGDKIPCHVSIPRDILTAPAGDIQVPLLNKPAPPGISGDIEKAAGILLRSPKTVIIPGREAIPHRELVLQLARRTSAGIIPSLGARGIFPGDEPRVLGGLGPAHIPPLLSRAGCVLLAGTAPYEQKFIPPGIEVVQLSTGLQNTARELNPVAVTGDMAGALETLIEKLGGKKANAGWRQEIKAGHRDYVNMITREADLNDKPVSPRQVVALLNEVLPEDAVITIDSGEFMHWFNRGFIARRQQVLISEYWRCMGGALPLGLGARAAAPGTKVVALAGEGSFIMTMPEILTAVRYSLPVVVVIFNNGSYVLEEHRMQESGLQPFGVEVATPRFAELARSSGAAGYRVEEPGELREILAGALARDCPAIVDIAVSKEKPPFGV